MLNSTLVKKMQVESKIDALSKERANLISLIEGESPRTLFYKESYRAISNNTRALVNLRKEWARLNKRD